MCGECKKKKIFITKNTKKRYKLHRESEEHWQSIIPARNLLECWLHEYLIFFRLLLYISSSIAHQREQTWRIVYMLCIYCVILNEFLCWCSIKWWWHFSVFYIYCLATHWMQRCVKAHHVHGSSWSVYIHRAFLTNFICMIAVIQQHTDATERAEID